MANDAEVIRQDAPAVTPPGAEKAKGKDDTVTLTRAEHDSLVRERNEAIESERYWSRSRTSEKAAPVEVEPEVETDDLIPQTGNNEVDDAIFSDPDKWAEAISKGPKAIEAFVRKAGFVTGAEVASIAAKVAQRTVALEKTRMAGDSVIITEFPQLNDPKSELFIATTAEVRSMVKMDPNAAKSPATLLAAARIASLKLAAKAPARRADPDDDDGDGDRYERAEHEDDRRSRSDAQDTSRGRGRRESADDDSALGDQAKEVLRMMGGITEADFIAERKKLGPAARRR